jgi:hypothetical protein
VRDSKGISYIFCWVGMRCGELLYVVDVITLDVVNKSPYVGRYSSVGLGSSGVRIPNIVMRCIEQTSSPYELPCLFNLTPYHDALARQRSPKLGFRTLKLGIDPESHRNYRLLLFDGDLYTRVSYEMRSRYVRL